MLKIRNKVDPIIILDDEEEDLFIFEKAYSKSDLSNPLIKFMTSEELSTHLDKVKKQEEPMPALLIIDINLGISNGFDVVEGIRKDHFFNPIPTIMMLTSSTNQVDKDRTSKVGADAFAVKPHGFHDYVEFLNTLKD